MISFLALEGYLYRSYKRSIRENEASHLCSFSICVFPIRTLFFLNEPLFLLHRNIEGFQCCSYFFSCIQTFQTLCHVVMNFHVIGLHTIVCIFSNCSRFLHSLLFCVSFCLFFFKVYI